MGTRSSLPVTARKQQTKKDTSIYNAKAGQKCGDEAELVTGFIFL